MANETPLISSIIDPESDPLGHLGLIRKPESTTPISFYEGSPRLLVKDIPVNRDKNTFVRVFLPKEAIETLHAGKKLPLLIFMHAGGFVIFKVNSSVFNNFYDALTTNIPAVIVSMEYRRAPEHRLPAAYEDGMETLQWIQNTRDEWLAKYADFSNAFVMGNSAGSNLAYHVVLRFSSLAHGLKPLDGKCLEIKGVILHEPFLGGTKRTKSELSNKNDQVIPPSVSDLYWVLALPVGADRDHEYSNPVLNIKPGQFDHIKALGWKILVTGYEGDRMYDRQVELVKVLEDNGVNVVAKFQEGGFHSIDGTDPARLRRLCETVQGFVKLHCN